MYRLSRAQVPPGEARSRPLNRACLEQASFSQSCTQEDVTAFRYRVLTTWLVCGGWGAVAAAGLLYSRRALSGPAPFANLARALLHDLEIIEAQGPQISP
jgi:hypothetical protein